MNYQQSTVSKIALFGTSADPPTAGHQIILRWLSEQYDRVVVWASDNPFKDHKTTLKHRSQMLRLAIEEIASNKNNLDVFPELSDRRSLVTIHKARKIWREAEFTFVIGADLVSQIASWYHIEELLAQVKLLVIPRPGYSITESDLNSLKNLGADYTIANLNAPQISSTAYRNNGDETILTPAVAAYINQQELYSLILSK